MSYSNVYNGEVYYDGYVEYSYPPSDKGGTGTKHYSGKVPVSWRVNVNTTPFDASIASCNRHLNALTGSVTAMNAAQVHSIHKASDRISDHITGGFFSLIKSELSQNMAASFSKMQGTMGLLHETASMLSAQHETMARDYNRIKGRYEKVFSDLDEELKRRIYELDKRAFELSEQIKTAQLCREVTEATAKFLLPMNEGTAVNQQLSAASLKSKVAGSIEDLSKNVTQEVVYAKKVDSIITDYSCEENTRECIPVVYTEQSDLDQEDLQSSSCYVADISGREEIQGTVKNYFTTEHQDLNQMDDKEKEAVSKSFNLLAEQALNEAEQNGNTNAKRVFDMIMSLKDKNVGMDN